MKRHAVVRRPPTRDDTTRYLCAATQLDAKFADDAIREFLVEPTRPVAPSPGTDATAVLGEAIAARARRKYRDGALAVLAMIAIFTAPVSMLVGWFAVALLASVRQVSGQFKSLTGKGNAVPLVLAAAGVVALAILGPPLYEELAGPSVSSRRRASDTGDSGGLAIALVMIAGMLGVLLTDRLIVWQHLTRRFSRGSGPVADPLTTERPVMTMGTTFMHELRRVAATERGHPEQEGAPLVVYRGYSPFVGAGFEFEPWSIAVPLHPIPDKEQKRLTTEELYTRIRESLAGLGEATPLTPSERLSSLRITDQVIVPADELIDHLADPATRVILAGPEYPPYPVLSPQDVASLRAEPEEWARYYLCVQVETWDRDLVISVFIHAALDETTLYVEWTPCVLLPIRREYQEIDQLPPGPLRPVLEAVRRLLRLPITILPDTVNVLRMIRRLPRRAGTIDPRAYGSLRSLREMAAADDVRSYLQLADIDRYLKILGSRFVPAVSKLLQDSGYSAEGFVEQAVTVHNRNVYIGGSVTGNLNLGDRSTLGNVKKSGGSG